MLTNVVRELIKKLKVESFFIGMEKIVLYQGFFNALLYYFYKTFLILIP